MTSIRKQPAEVHGPAPPRQTRPSLQHKPVGDRQPHHREDGVAAASPEVFLRTILRGSNAEFPAGQDPCFNETLMALAEVNGVAALLHWTISANDTLESWPAPLSTQLQTLAYQQAIRELTYYRELTMLLERCARAELSTLLIKGTPLAYSHYAQPYLRTRGDTDILIREVDRELAHRILVDAGYHAQPSPARQYASYQRNYVRNTGADVGHQEVVIDLHWRLSNREGFASCFTFDELNAASQPVATLGPHARTLDPVHALILACMHRATHIAAPYSVHGIPYREPNRLIWLYDILLLCGAFSDEEWDRAANLIADKQLRAVCRDALSASQGILGASVPARLCEQIAKPSPTEPTARYLSPEYWRSHMLADLLACRSMAQQLALIGEWAVPPSSYILERHQARSRWLLPFLYLHRALHGLYKLLQRTPSR